MGERGIMETYKGFVGLAENLGKQKRWSDAAEAWVQALELGSRMFGEEHEQVVQGRFAHARAERLARYQRYIRFVIWGFTLLIPVAIAWAWKHYEWNLAVWSLGIALGLADPP